MLKSLRIFAALGIFLFFAGALLSVGASVKNAPRWQPFRYVKSRHLFKRELAHLDKKTLSLGAIFEEESDLPTKDTRLSNLSKKTEALETSTRVSFQNYRTYSTLRVTHTPKVSVRILQSVLIL